MGRIPSLIAYPIFRLTVSMATGIFLFDRFLAGSVSVWPLVGVLLALLVVLFLDFRNSAYRSRLWFGVASAMCFLLIGGIRLLQEKEKIHYDWSKSQAVYWGKVVTPPVEKGKTFQAEVFVEGMYELADSLPSDSVGILRTGEKQCIPIQRKILLYWMPDSTQQSLDCGRELLFAAKIGRPISDVELTGFDYNRYLFRKGISGTAIAFTGNWQMIETADRLSLKQRALLCRQWIVNRYREWNLGKEEFAVVAALTIGDKSVLTSELKDIYSVAGVSHVLALSGLHVGILSAILFFLLAPVTRIGGGEVVRSLLVVLALWGFAFVSGLSPSVVRAVTMCSLYFGARCVTEERFSGNYALTLTAFLMLLYQPLYLFDLSFQLSFLAVCSILYFYPLISSCLHLSNRLLRWVWNALAVSISAQLGTLPLILYCFGTFPTYFLLANLIVGTLAVCILTSALVGLVCSSIPVVGTWVVGFLNWSTTVLNTSMRWVEQLAGSQLTALSISTLQALCGFLFLYSFYHFCLHRRARYLIGMLLALNLTFGEWIYAKLRPQETTLHFSRGELFLKQGEEVEELTVDRELLQVDSLRIGVFTSGYWKDKTTDQRISLDYIYLCRGFKGNIHALLRVFEIHHVILDSSLTDRYRKYLIQECIELKIPFKDISEQGSHIIFL